LYRGRGRARFRPSAGSHPCYPGHTDGGPPRRKS
jgi:hypothetical protein